jgi:hypothetical protein
MASDPTGQGNNRRRATRLLRDRLTVAQRAVRRLFRDIPRTRRQEAVISNARVVPVYDYRITSDELEQLERQIRGTIGDELLETQFNRMPPNWWWQGVVEPAYRQGTAEEIVEFNQLVTAELIRTRTVRGVMTQRLEVGAVLQSQEYLESLNKVYVRNFAGIKSLSDRTSDQVVQVINAGIAAGQTPTDISKAINERFDVSRTSAARTANTEVNKAYNDARLDSTTIAAKVTGMRAGVLHLSALIPTSRHNHVARHGNAYTVAQQRQWWDSGTNRINCHCSTRSVLIDNKGNVIDVELHEEIRVEREKFDL